MKYLDTVEVVAEKARYSKEGVHKGMQGVIFDERKIDGFWLVCFPQHGEKEDIAQIGVKEEDLVLISAMDARKNETIKKQFNLKEE